MRIVRRASKTPYRWQQETLKNLRRYNVIVAPRQHGKSELVNEILHSVATDETIYNPVINLCAPSAKQVFRLYKERLDSLFEDYPDYHWSSEDTTTLRIRRASGDHITINIFGADKNYYGPKGTTAHLNIIDEAGKCPEGFAQEACMPATDITNGITIITGTVEANHYYEDFLFGKKEMQDPESPWYVFYMKFGDEYSNEIHNEKAKKDIVARYDMSNPVQRLLFEKEYMCNWLAGARGTPFAGFVYQSREQGRIGKFPLVPCVPVGTSWDNGQSTAIWFWQYHMGNFRMVDFKQWEDIDYHTIFKEVKQWYRDHGVPVGTYVFPHTMAERQQISFNKQLYRLAMEEIGGFNRINNVRVGRIDTKIQYTQNFFKMCVFNEETTAKGLMSLQLYKRSGNIKKGIRGMQMIKDKFSHGAEAFTELALAKANNKFAYIDGEAGSSTDEFKDMQGLLPVLFPY